MPVDVTFKLDGRSMNFVPPILFDEFPFLPNFQAHYGTFLSGQVNGKTYNAPLPFIYCTYPILIGVQVFPFAFFFFCSFSSHLAVLGVDPYDRSVPNTPHHTAPHHTTLFYSVPYGTALHPHRTVRHRATLHHTTPHSTVANAPHHTTSHYTAQYPTPHRTAQPHTTNVNVRASL